MLTAPDLDPKAVRRQFSRRANSPGRADFLFAEVEARMLERLDLVRLSPRNVLDVGCGAGRSLLALRKRFASAQLLGLDSASAMARAARAALHRLRAACSRVCAPAAKRNRWRKSPWPMRMRCRWPTLRSI